MEGLRAYAFVSVFLAHAADGMISAAETAALQRNVRRATQALGFSTSQSDALLRATMDDYERLLATVPKAELMGRFRRDVQELSILYGSDPYVLQGIQQDLRDIAAADGDVLDMEDFLIRHVAETWWRLRRT